MEAVPVWPEWAKVREAWEDEVPRHIRRLVLAIRNAVMPDNFRTARAKKVAEVLGEFGVKFRYLTDGFHYSGYTKYYPKLKVIRIFSGGIDGYFRRQRYSIMLLKYLQHSQRSRWRRLF